MSQGGGGFFDNFLFPLLERTNTNPSSSILQSQKKFQRYNFNFLETRKGKWHLASTSEIKQLFLLLHFYFFNTNLKSHTDLHGKLKVTLDELSSLSCEPG